MTAVAEVAAAHDLDPTWLNAGAARFTPATLDIDDCDRLLEPASNSARSVATA